MKRLATIGYEGATERSFLDALSASGVRVVADVRAVARSRSPGFAKTRLAAALKGAGIEYVHLRGLGTPAEGRAAARAGNQAEMHRIFRAHLSSAEAEADLDQLIQLIDQQGRVCLLCLEADPARCHRSLVAEAVGERIAIEVHHLDAGGH